MIDTSFIRSVVEGMKKQRQRPEEGTDELTQEYKELTPGQTNEDTDKDEPGTQGDQAEYQKKRKEIANKFGVESCSALKDEKERKACYAALDAAHVSDDEEEDEDDDPVGKNEEVEYDEKKMKALAKKDKLIGKMMKTTSAKTVFNSEVLGNSSMEKAYQKEEVEVDESTAEYAKSLEKIANDRALKMLSKSERGNLKKIAALLDKEKKEEVEVDEARKAAKDIGLECQECGKKFRSKLSTLQYGKTKCPKCKSTDLDFAYGESVEEGNKLTRQAEEVELESMTEEIHQLEERRQSYSNFIPFPEKILTDFAKRAIKAGLTFAQYMKYVKGTFKDGADSNNAIIFGRDVYKKKKGAVDPDAWNLKKEDVEIDEGVAQYLAKKGTYDVKYASSKKGPIKVTKFASLDKAKEFLASVKKDGMNGIISKGGKPVKEDLDEKKGSDYELYHKDFSGAMQHAYAVAKKRGYTVDKDDIDNKVATGPKKPSKGKSNRYILGTDKKQNLHVQVANLDNKRYELNMYIESNEQHLNKVRNIIEKRQSVVQVDEIRDGTDYESQAKMMPKVLMNGIMKVIPGVKLVQFKIKHPREGHEIPGLGLVLSGEKEPRLMVQFQKFVGTERSGKPITDKDDNSGKTTVTDLSKKDNYTLWALDKLRKAPMGGKGKVSWFEMKDGRDPQTIVQYLKSKIKRLTKEEVVVEREMSDAEKDKREEIVLSLKKKEKEFKERYGDKWKEVMYATATKMAMGENTDEATLGKGRKLTKREQDAVMGDDPEQETASGMSKKDANKLRKKNRKEEDPKSKKKDKINLKPKMDENMKTLKDIRNQMQEHCGECGLVGTEKKIKKEEVKEAITDMGAEVGEQDWDGPHRPENAYPNLNVNFAKFMEEDLEGPYMFEGENYFFDRKMGSWYSVSGEDYVDEDLNKVLSHNYVKTELVKQ